MVPAGQGAYDDWTSRPLPAGPFATSGPSTSSVVVMPAGPAGPCGPVAPGAPGVPAGPRAPAGSCPDLKSRARSERSFTEFELTEFLGIIFTAAVAVPPSAENSAMSATTFENVARDRTRANTSGSFPEGSPAWGGRPPRTPEATVCLVVLARKEPSVSGGSRHWSGGPCRADNNALAKVLPPIGGQLTAAGRSLSHGHDRHRWWWARGAEVRRDAPG